MCYLYINSYYFLFLDIIPWTQQQTFLFWIRKDIICVYYCYQGSNEFLPVNVVASPVFKLESSQTLNQNSVLDYRKILDIGSRTWNIYKPYIYFIKCNIFIWISIFVFFDWLLDVMSTFWILPTHCRMFSK